MSLYDMQGRLVEFVFREMKSPGIYDHEISVEHLDPGIYFYRFAAGDHRESGKMMVQE